MDGPTLKRSHRQWLRRVCGSRIARSQTSSSTDCATRARLARSGTAACQLKAGLDRLKPVAKELGNGEMKTELLRKLERAFLRIIGAAFENFGSDAESEERSTVAAVHTVASKTVAASA